MNEHINIKVIDANIQLMKKAAEELELMADNFPALARNTARILASLKMLEINVSDVIQVSS